MIWQMLLLWPWIGYSYLMIIALIPCTVANSSVCTDVYTNGYRSILAYSSITKRWPSDKVKDNCETYIKVQSFAVWNAVVDTNHNFILYIAIYMPILLYAAIASYLTTVHNCLSLLDHLFNSL